MKNMHEIISKRIKTFSPESFILHYHCEFCEYTTEKKIEIELHLLKFHSKILFERLLDSHDEF